MLSTANANNLPDNRRSRFQERKARFAADAVKMRDLRQTLGVSQCELANKTGVSATLIWNIEHERGYFSEKMMKRIEKAYPELSAHGNTEPTMNRDVAMKKEGRKTMVCNEKLPEIDLSGYQVIKRELVRKKKVQPDGLMAFDFGKPSRVIFDKSSLEAIGNPEYIHVLINVEAKILMLAKTAKGGGRSGLPKGTPVEPNGDGAFVMENCDAFLFKVAKMMGWNLSRSTKMLFAGKAQEDKIAFRLFDALMFTSGDADELTEYMMNIIADKTSA